MLLTRGSNRRWIRATLLALLPVGAAACGTARGEPQAAPPSTAGAADTATEAELEALYRARRDSARMRFTEADVRFMTGMIAHHAQALVMSNLAPTHGASPSVRTLAARIINAQKDEIATMERWLRERGQPVPEVEIDGLSLVVDGVQHGVGPTSHGEEDRAAHEGRAARNAGHDEHAAHGAGGRAHMPGMLSAEQLRELDRARGTEFDRLFLEYMIQHHGGAITMVHDLFATDGAAQGVLTFKLASDIQVDQATEIARMELMLSDLTPADGS